MIRAHTCAGTGEAMKLSLLFFAKSKDIVGESSLEWEAKDGCVVKELVSAVVGKYPALQDLVKNLVLSVNLDYVGVDSTRVLTAKDEIAFIPPLRTCRPVGSHTVARGPRGQQTRRGFFTVAEHCGVDVAADSAVHRGLNFELQTQTALRQLGMHLDHVGAAHDMGVDLRGTWRTGELKPSVFGTSSTGLENEQATDLAEVPVIVQCKAETKETSPRVMRELQGTLATMESPNTLGILSSVLGFTAAAMDQSMRSPCPLALVRLEPAAEESSSAVITQFKLNPIARALLSHVMVVKGRGVAATGRPVLSVVLK